MSYFITNGCHFLRFKKLDNVRLSTEYEKMDSIDSANYFKFNDAMDMIEKISGVWGCAKVRSNKKGKNFIITDATKYAGLGKGSAVRDYTKRKSFRTYSEAELYLRTYPLFENAIIVDQDWRPQENVKHFTDEQLAILGVADNRIKRVKIGSNIRQQVYEKGGGVCAICGRPVNYEQFTIDHIVPIARGGTNEISNFQIACNVCNKLKADSLDSEYITSATSMLSSKIEDDTELAKPIIRSYVRSIISGMYGCNFTQQVMKG